MFFRNIENNVFFEFFIISSNLFDCLLSLCFHILAHTAAGACSSSHGTSKPRRSLRPQVHQEYPPRSEWKPIHLLARHGVPLHLVDEIEVLTRTCYICKDDKERVVRKRCAEVIKHSKKNIFNF